MRTGQIFATLRRRTTKSGHFSSRINGHIIICLVLALFTHTTVIHPILRRLAKIHSESDLRKRNHTFNFTPFVVRTGTVRAREKKLFTHLYKCLINLIHTRTSYSHCCLTTRAVRAVRAMLCWQPPVKGNYTHAQPHKSPEKNFCYVRAHMPGL